MNCSHKQRNCRCTAPAENNIVQELELPLGTCFCSQRGRTHSVVELKLRHTPTPTSCHKKTSTSRWDTTRSISQTVHSWPAPPRPPPPPPPDAPPPPPAFVPAARSLPLPHQPRVLEVPRPARSLRSVALWYGTATNDRLRSTCFGHSTSTTWRNRANVCRVTWE